MHRIERSSSLSSSCKSLSDMIYNHRSWGVLSFKGIPYPENILKAQYLTNSSTSKCLKQQILNCYRNSTWIQLCIQALTFRCIYLFLSICMYITTQSHRMCSSLSQTSTKLIIYYVWIFSTKQKLHQVMRCFGLPSGTTQDYRVPSPKLTYPPQNMPKPTQKGGKIIFQPP